MDKIEEMRKKKDIKPTNPRNVAFYVGTGNGFMAGLVLVSEEDNAQNFIGKAPGIHLSKFAMWKGGGRIIVPGKCGMGYKIAGELFCDQKAGFYEFDIMRGLYYRKWGKARNINLPEYISSMLEDVKKVSDHLEMPVMLEYNQKIIDLSMKGYLKYYIKEKFKSGTFRGSKRFEMEMKLLFDELNGLKNTISPNELDKYKIIIEIAARRARKLGIKERKQKRLDKQNAKERKQKRRKIS